MYTHNPICRAQVPSIYSKCGQKHVPFNLYYAVYSLA